MGQIQDQLSSIDRQLCNTIIEAYRRGFTVQSDYARQHADYVAMAASLGLLSTRLYGNIYSREWRPTVKGLSFVNQALNLDLEAEDLDPGHD